MNLAVGEKPRAFSPPYRSLGLGGKNSQLEWAQWLPGSYTLQEKATPIPSCGEVHCMYVLGFLYPFISC